MFKQTKNKINTKKNSSSSSSLHVYIPKHDCQWDSCPLYTEKLSMDYSEKKISICSITKNKVELIWTEISPTGQLKSDFCKNNYGLVDISTMDRDTQNISTMDRHAQNISTMDRDTHKTSAPWTETRTKHQHQRGQRDQIKDNPAHYRGRYL